MTAEQGGFDRTVDRMDRAVGRGVEHLGQLFEGGPELTTLYLAQGITRWLPVAATTVMLGEVPASVGAPAIIAAILAAKVYPVRIALQQDIPPTTPELPPMR